MKEYNITPEFIAEVASNTDLQNRFKADPVKTLSELSVGSPLSTDTWIYRIIVMALSILIILCAVFYFVISQTEGAQIPESLVALGSAALGALTGLLAPSPVKG